ncbi:MAG: hypothetical protein IJX92_05165 [Clostridia bacterium]|nr:hypothetical protein [Clostridia bacterium]
MREANLNVDTRYDVASIAEKMQKQLLISVTGLVLGTLVAILSVIGIILFGHNVLKFIGSALCLIGSLMLVGRETKKIKNHGCTKTTVGRVSDVDLHVGVKDSRITVGYGGLVRKRYESYKRDLYEFTVFIDEGSEVKPYTLRDVSHTLDGYYEIGDEVLHIGGTRFPVKRDIDLKWLCPVCAELNPKEQSICSCCKNKILK